MNWNQIISELPATPAPLLLETRIENNTLVVHLTRPPWKWRKDWPHLIAPGVCAVAGLVAIALATPVTRQLGTEHPSSIMVLAPSVVILFASGLWALYWLLVSSPLFSRITIQLSATQLRVGEVGESGWIIPLADIRAIKLVRDRMVEIQTPGGFILLFESAERLQPQGIRFIADILTRATGITVAPVDSVSKLQGTVRIAGDQIEITRRVWYALITVAALLATCIAVWQFVEIHEQNAAQSWPSVEGRVTRSEWVQLKEHSDYFRIEYRYAVNGVQYENSRVHVSQRRSFDRGMLNTHPVRSKVTVYFNPEYPSQATLYREWTFLDWLGIAMVPLMAILPIIMLRHPPNPAKVELAKRYFHIVPLVKQKPKKKSLGEINLGWLSALITFACTMAFAILLVVRVPPQLPSDSRAVLWTYTCGALVALISCYPLYSVWRRQRIERIAENRNDVSGE